MQPRTNPFQPGIKNVCGGCKDDKACQVCGCPEHYICNKKLMMEVAARLPSDWEKLGIYLGISKQERDGIGGEKRNKVEAWGLDMFNKWWQNAKPDSRWSDLQNALTEVHRHDLIQFTKDFFADNNVNPINPAQHKMDKYFQKMAEQIPRDWKDIGIYLYLSLDDLHAIQMAETSTSKNTRTYQILEAWCKSANTKYGDLISTLEEIGRRDVVMYIEQEVQSYKQVCPLSEERREQQQREQEQEQRQVEQLQRQRQQLEQQLEQQRQLLEQQRLQLQQPGFRPIQPPTANYIPPNERDFHMQPARFVPHPSHEYGHGPPPPRTAFNQGAVVDGVQQSESVSRNSLITHPTHEPSRANPDHGPSPQLRSADVNSLQPGCSNPSFVNSPSTELTPGVAQAERGISNIHLDSHDGSANTFSNDLTTDLTTDNTTDNLSLSEIRDNPNSSQTPVGVPSTSVIM